VIVLVKYSSNF